MISHFVPIWNMWRVPRFSVTFASQWRNCSAGNRWKQIGGQCTERDEKEYHQGRNGDILKRVKEVKRVEDSRRVVENLLREGYPIAVDLEGISGNHRSSCTGLVSIKDVHGNFTFFRPRRNPALYQEGGLATLLESHHVLKIMHASGGDASSLYRDGVKLWNVFDTEVAHRVLEFQINGASLTNFQAIGLNNLCAYCGIESNPLKGKIKFNPWNEKNVNENKNVMSEEFLLYSAWDVEQLHEIHQILSSLISPDYQSLATQLSEVELIRCFDPDLAAIKKTNVKAMESRTLFMSRLSPDVRKPDLYETLALSEGNKQVFFSPTHATAHLVLESRAAAVQTLSKLKYRQGQLGVSGRKATVSLVQKLEKSEVFVVDNEVGKEVITDGLTSQDLVVEVLAAVVEAEVPVVLEFVTNDLETIVNIFYGLGPSLKLLLNEENVAAGLGALMRSETVPKILFKVGDIAVAQAFKTLSRLGVKPSNIFDIESAAKMCDYVECGQSIFTSAGKKMQKLAMKYRLPESPTSGKVDWFYLTFLHLTSVLPSPILALLREKTDLEVGIASYQDIPELKSQRTHLRRRMDGQTLHLRKLSGSKNAFQIFVEQTIKAGGQEIQQFHVLPRGLFLVTFDTRRTALEAFTLLQAQQDTEEAQFRFVVTLPERLGTLTDGISPTSPIAELGELESKRAQYLSRLKQARRAYVEDSSGQIAS